MANWGNYILSVAVSFFMMPFIIYHLGDVRYGIWVLVISLTGYLGLLDLGIGGSVIKYVAQFESQKDQKRMNSMSSSVFYLYSGIAIVIILISICIATYALQYFRIPDEYLAVAKYVAIITGMNIALSFPFGFYGGYLRGIQRYDLIALLDTMVLLFRTLLTVLFLLWGYGLIALAWIQLVSAILGGIIRMICVYKYAPQLRIHPSLINIIDLRMAFGYSYFLFVSDMAERGILYKSSIIIGYFLSAADITVYSVGETLVEASRWMIVSMVGVLAPTVSVYDAKGEIEKIQELLIQGTRYSLTVFSPIALIFLFLGKDIINLWVGPRFVPSANILVVLTVGYLAYTFQTTSFRILLGMAKHQAAAYSNACQAIFSIGLSIALVQEYGVIGVAWGTAIPMVLINLFVLPVYTCKIIKLPIVILIRDTLNWLVIPTMLCVSSLVICDLLIGASTWLDLIVSASISTGLYMLFIILFRISCAERKLRFSQLKAVINMRS